MKPSVLVQLFSALSFPGIRERLSSQVGGCLLGTTMAAIGVSIAATPVTAQICCQPTVNQRSVNVTRTGGFVSTSTGIGLNVRSGPGLSFPIIDGAEDGVFLDLAGRPVFADGYRWQRTTTGGWVATDFVAGGTTNVSLTDNGDGCFRRVSACGGDSQPIVRPISVRPVVVRPISTGAGPYVVAVPGADPATFAQVRRLAGTASVDRAREGTFVNAGSFQDYEGARSLSYLLRSSGLDARVIYR